MSTFRTFRREWDAAALLTDHPPRFRHPNKLLVQAIAAGPPRGTIVASRWRAMPLPDALPAQVPAFDALPGYFTYDPPAPGWFDWHLNFADPVLFGYYATGLFAQDEMQVCEHPALASVAEALNRIDGLGITEEAGAPTPILVAGVERRVTVDTDPTPERPMGLYGKCFAYASEAAIRSATRRIDPPTLSNILAIAAPAGGHGRYGRDEIERVLVTAYTGFAAAKAESTSAYVAIHTGFWGCGAFGGDRVLMTTLQALAARLAGIDRLVFHYGDASGEPSVDQARRELASLAPLTRTEECLATLDARGFRWGVSDGN